MHPSNAFRGMEPSLLAFDVAVVGAGAFGSSAAAALCARGFRVALIDGGGILERIADAKPQHAAGSSHAGASGETIIQQAQRGGGGVVVGGGRDMASSADVSKILRSDYGTDSEMAQLHEVALTRWDALEKRWEKRLHDGEAFQSLYPVSKESRFVHWSGVAVLSRDTDPAPGSFVRESLKTLDALPLPDPAVCAACSSSQPPPRSAGNGALFERTRKLVGVEAVRERLAPFNSPDAPVKYPFAYINRAAGWAESGRCTEQLVLDAIQAGATPFPFGISQLQFASGNTGSQIICTGVKLQNGETVSARCVVVAAGAWTPSLVPESRRLLRPVAMGVFHFTLTDAAARERFSERFMPYTADISRTGFYGFPFHKGDRVLKVGHHGAGFPFDSTIGATRESLQELAERVRPSEEARFRQFLRGTFPEIADAPVAMFRLCQYCDSHNADFLIGAVPGYALEDGKEIKTSLVVASGGSGHGFKFAPVLGDIIAGAVCGTECGETAIRAAQRRFRWRESGDKWLTEAARLQNIHNNLALPVARL